MYHNAKIFLDSPDLYQAVYRCVFDQPGESVPKSFSYNEHMHFQLIDLLPGDGIQVEQYQEVLAYLDGRYEALRNYTNSEIKTIWYNPEGEIVDDKFPIQDVDITDFTTLKDVLTMIDKPSLAQCMDWWEEWDVPENIRHHSTVVARSAYVVAMKMRKKGISLDPILAHRAGLVHDLDKIDTLHESGAHGMIGADFLAARGYPKVGKIVRDHIMSTINHSDFESRSWENKLVFFCDKLVEGDELVPFDRRLAALKIRYPFYVEKMERAESAIWDLSDEICGILGVKSHVGLVEMLREMQ